MTLKDYATVQRAIGIIEGIAASEEATKATALRDAVEIIVGVIDKKGETE